MSAPVLHVAVPTRPSARRPRWWRVVAALLIAVAWSSGWAQERELDPRVFDVARQLRCPTCVSESVAQSSSPIAREMRVIIQEQLDAGRSRGEILAFFQQRYGDWILLEPPRRGLHLLVWVLPVTAALLGVVVLVVAVRRWRAAAVTPVEASDQELQRVRAALTAGDAGGGAAGEAASADDTAAGTARS